MPFPRNHSDEPRPGDVLSLDLDLLDANPFQPRTEMDATKLAELAASLASSGQLQPIAVRPVGPGRYQIVAGHRRVAAFRQLLAAATTEADRRTWALIRAHVVATVTDLEMATAAYVENTARVDLNPLDEAAALANIRQLGGHSTAGQVAKATAQPERRVRLLLRLFTAPPVVKDAVSKGLLVDASESGEPPKRERRKLDLLAALEFARLHEFQSTRKPTTADERTTTAIARALRESWGLRRIQRWVEASLNGTSPREIITDTHPAVPATAVPPAKDKGTAPSGSVHEPRPHSGSPAVANRVVACSPAVANRDRSPAPPVDRSSAPPVDRSPAPPVDRSSAAPGDVCSSSSDRFTLYLSRLKAASRAQLEAAEATIDDIRQLVRAQLELKGTGPGEA